MVRPIPLFPPTRPLSCASSVRRVLLSASVAFATACGGGRQLNVPDFRGSPSFRSEAIVLDVQNLNYADIVVYGSRGGSWQRLGDVTGNTSAVLEISENLTRGAPWLQLRVHAIGSPDSSDYYTDRISVPPGAMVQLRVAPVLRMSSWSVR